MYAPGARRNLSIEPRSAIDILSGMPRHPSGVDVTWRKGGRTLGQDQGGNVFNEVPLMPLIGPLIARPVEDGQPGYFMVVHAPASLRSGSPVTVQLADYTFEHVPVQ